MITGQDQKAGDNSLAIQARGSVTVNQGMSLAQMSEIMVELQRLVGEFTAEAQVKADERLDRFRAEMLEKFSDPTGGNSEAFKDPDFQFLLKSAQVNYARDGNETTSNLLVELLSERSKVPQRDRIALILNEATDKISKLTDEDVAILTLGFVILKTGGGATDYTSLVKHYETNIAPFVTFVREGSSAYAYLESLGCLTVNSVISTRLSSFVYGNYDLLFIEPFFLRDLTPFIGVKPDYQKLFMHFTPQIPEVKLPPVSDNPLNMPPPVSFEIGDLNFKFLALNTTALKQNLTKSDLSSEIQQGIINFATSRVPSETDALNRLNNSVPAMATLGALWDKIELSRMNLTSVGLVIGHANLSSVNSEFKTPLATWIS